MGETISKFRGDKRARFFSAPWKKKYLLGRKYMSFGSSLMRNFSLQSTVIVKKISLFTPKTVTLAQVVYSN